MYTYFCLYLQEYSSIHYDFKNKRSALFMNIVKRDEEHKLQVVSLCDAKVRIYFKSMLWFKFLFGLP